MFFCVKLCPLINCPKTVKILAVRGLMRIGFVNSTKLLRYISYHTEKYDVINVREEIIFADYYYLINFSMILFMLDFFTR